MFVRASHKAILDYLSSAGFGTTFEEFKKEANLVRMLLRNASGSMADLESLFGGDSPISSLISDRRRTDCWLRNGRA